METQVNFIIRYNDDIELCNPISLTSQQKILIIKSLFIKKQTMCYLSVSKYTKGLHQRCYFIDAINSRIQVLNYIYMDDCFVEEIEYDEITIGKEKIKIASGNFKINYSNSSFIMHAKFKDGFIDGCFYQNSFGTERQLYVKNTVSYNSKQEYFLEKANYLVQQT